MSSSRTIPAHPSNGASSTAGHDDNDDDGTSPAATRAGGSGPSAVFIVWSAPNYQLKPGINRNPDPPRGCPRVKMLDASTRGKRLA